ncbi:LPS biosynthesis glycosyltransferase, partial [Acinetobacter baumannii]
SFLFDHPIIENNDALSYLEKERSLVGSHSQDDSDFLRYLRVKLKKYILNKYII